MLADVCKVLEISNIGMAASRLDSEEKSSIRNPDATSVGGNPNILTINESGLYSLILTSRLLPRLSPPSRLTACPCAPWIGMAWWVLADVCKVLEIGHAPSVAQRLDDDEKVTVAINHSGPPATVINESGLYSLILTSRLLPRLSPPSRLTACPCAPWIGMASRGGCWRTCARCWTCRMSGKQLPVLISMKRATSLLVMSLDAPTEAWSSTNPASAP